MKKHPDEVRHVFSDAELAVRRMRVTGMKRATRPDERELALREYEYRIAQLGAASEELAIAFGKVDAAKRAVIALGIDISSVQGESKPPVRDRTPASERAAS